MPLYLVRFQILGMPSNLLEILIGLGFLIWICVDYRKILRELRGFPYLFPVALLLGGLILSALVGDNLRVSTGIIRGWFVFPLLFALMVRGGVNNEKDRLDFLQIFYWSAAAVSVIALMYFLYGYLTYDGRLRAFWQSPNHLAMYIAPGVILGFWKIFCKTKSRERKQKSINVIATITGLILMLLTLYLTYSYAAWIAVIIGILTVVIFGNKKKSKMVRWTVCLMMILVAIFIFQAKKSKFSDLVHLNERSSLASRVMIWESSLRIIQDNWLFGIGPGNFQDKYLDYQKHFPPYLEWAVPQPHNIFLAFWLQSGLLGLVGFVWLIALWYKKALEKIKRNEAECIPLVLLGIMTYFLFHGMVDTTYWKNDLSVMFWLVISLL